MIPAHPVNPANPAKSEQGAILLQVSFLILVLMGLVALVVDMGIARATQGFMQAGADAASLEGLRFRDVLPGDPVQSDLNRRMAAARAAALTYDEDLDLGTGPSAYRLGAGPQIDTGVAGVHDPAGGLLVDQGPYLPALELNAGSNLVHGDLVSGAYIATDPGDPGNHTWHAEDGSYVRSDFVAAAPAGAPSAPAFLARLRRTNDLAGLDRQPGVSSAGPTVPFLFGLGSGVLTTEDATVYDPRRDGITIRATAIAEARPAVAAGVASAIVNGVVPLGIDAADPTTNRVLAFEDASWQVDFLAGGPLQVVVATDSGISGVPGGPSPGAVGLAQPTGTLMRVGDAAQVAPVPGSVALAGAATGIAGVRYVALYTASGGGTGVITGFAAVRIDDAFPGTDPSGNPTLTLVGEKLVSLVAPENASAVPALATNLGALLPPSALREPLLAPVLVR